jgi:hypothetical protein
MPSVRKFLLFSIMSAKSVFDALNIAVVAACFKTQSSFIYVSHAARRIRGFYEPTKIQSGMSIR